MRKIWGSTLLIDFSNKIFLVKKSLDDLKVPKQRLYSETDVKIILKF